VTDRLVLDAGALIALERNDRRMWARLEAAADASLEVVVPPGALAQVWRGTANQARLNQALKKTRLGEFDDVARAAGELCHAARTADPIDADVVLNATGTTSVIVTSDPNDIRRLVRALPKELGSAITIRRI
jgi:monomeric isocitrate dehydrogenase